MARKRMFSLDVVDTDRFLDMSAAAQALYFHLGMHADDDGFVASPKKIARAAGSNDDDLRLLAAKEFIIPFESGVVVITDWKINNTLKGDRYSATVHVAEKAQLVEDTSKKYVLGSKVVPKCVQNGSKLVPQYSKVKDREVEGSKEKGPDKPSRSRFVPPSVEEVRAYCQEKGYQIDPKRFVAYYEATGWTRGKTKIKDWRACVRTWVRQSKDATQPALSKATYSPPESSARPYWEDDPC